jgi:hypothetical protein
MTNSIKPFEEANKMTFARKQRHSLGVNQSLEDKPVLYLSAHRGVYNAKFASHARAFAGALGGERTAFEDGKISTIVDLSETDPRTLTQSLFEFCSFIIQADNDERMIGSVDASSGTQAPLPGYIVNVIYLPPLDTEGNSKGPSVTYGIDRENFEHILGRLAKHLRNEDFLKEAPERISSNTGLLEKPEGP